MCEWTKQSAQEVRHCVNGPNKVHKKGFDIDLGKD